MHELPQAAAKHAEHLVIEGLDKTVPTIFIPSGSWVHAGRELRAGVECTVKKLHEYGYCVSVSENV